MIQLTRPMYLAMTICSIVIYFTKAIVCSICQLQLSNKNCTNGCLDLLLITLQSSIWQKAIFPPQPFQFTFLAQPFDSTWRRMRHVHSFAVDPPIVLRL